MCVLRFEIKTWLLNDSWIFLLNNRDGDCFLKTTPNPNGSINVKVIIALLEIIFKCNEAVPFTDLVT